MSEPLLNPRPHGVASSLTLTLMILEGDAVVSVEPTSINRAVARRSNKCPSKGQLQT